MSRSGYSEDCEGLNLWRGAVRSAINGKRGQAFLKELAAAMDAMPKKELIREELINYESGACCTIGVVCKSRGIQTDKIDAHDPTSVGKAVGIAMAMAAEIEYLNDEYGEHQTPQERWVRMRKWVGENLLEHAKGEHYH